MSLAGMKGRMPSSLGGRWFVWWRFRALQMLIGKRLLVGDVGVGPSEWCVGRVLFPRQ